MPVGKYHCDYCDKEFQDTSAARKRHLQGIQHQRAKALWYATNSHSDSSNQIPQEPLGKGVCNRFVRMGSCSYGDSCKYIHPRQSVQSLNPQDFPGIVVKGKIGNISLGSLPQSLQPPPDGGYPHIPFIDWG